MRLLTALLALGLAGCATTEAVEPELPVFEVPPMKLYCVEMVDGVSYCYEETALLVV